jgi:hypothetical protein
VDFLAFFVMPEQVCSAVDFGVNAFALIFEYFIFTYLCFILACWRAELPLKCCKVFVLGLAVLVL